MSAYEWITDEAFTNAVEQLVSEQSASALLAVPGIWEIVSEHFNNDAIELIEQDPSAFGLDAPCSGNREPEDCNEPSCKTCYPNGSFSSDDWTHLRETYESSLEDCNENGWQYEGEVVMTSIGYVDLGSDGCVTAFGADHGCVSEMA